MSLLATLQRVAATTERLDAAIIEIERERAARQQFETRITVRVERLEAQFADFRERLARIEASREGDHARIGAELARFQTEVERAELKLTRLLAEARRPTLPESEQS